MLRQCLLALTVLFAPLCMAGEFDAGRAPFSVHAGSVEIPYRVFGVFVLPGEELPLSVRDTAGDFRLHAASGDFHQPARNRWDWIAPSRVGHYPLEIIRGDGARIRLEVFVMVPSSAVRNGLLNGYRIGHYPRHLLRGMPIYAPPRGFVEVTPDLEHIPVSPHFTLGQFLCKQAGRYPKYLVLRERLLLKLEILVSHLNGHGVPTESLYIMSGYRTPWYNAGLGNVRYSRHTWGGAADIFIDDHPADGRMDDLNHDGRIDVEDARLLASHVDHLFREPPFDFLRGGMSAYPGTPTHGPFVHVDVRGFRARW